MEKPVPIRRVRIAVSVFFGLLTVALWIWWYGASEMNVINSTFGLGRRNRSLDVYVYLAAISSTVAGAPWWTYLPRQFSIRSMLIATTLVAVMLGLGMWLAG